MSGRSNRTQCCQRLVTAATLLFFERAALHAAEMTRTVDGLHKLVTRFIGVIQRVQYYKPIYFLTADK